VVAPHPDDEVLASGGLMMALSRRGVGLVIVGVTDGEASHPGSAAIQPHRLAAHRRREADRADARLGVTPRRHWLGVPDGQVADREAWLAATLGELLSGPAAPQLCVAPFPGDGHPDHEACGRAAAVAAIRSGAPLVSYPVWAWHWARPGDGRLPLADARALPLDRAQRTAKASAIAAHRSQLRPLGPDPADGPILTEGVLAHFARPFEVFLR
jgi:LmbE family N-acetylglucosaminyl deacetylase